MSSSAFGNVRLGRPGLRYDRRTLRLAKYVSKALLPKAPASVDWSKPVTAWPMYGNDSLGDCTVASAGHMIQAWTGNAGTLFTPAEPDVLAAYWATGAADDGRFELDVLNYWRKVGIGGHMIGAFAALDPRNHRLVKTACWLFGGCYVGVALPKTAQAQTNWTVVRGAGHEADPGTWGGHAVPIVGYAKTGVKIVTWGRVINASWGFLSKYMDEAYAVLGVDWLRKDGKAPSGFDVAALRSDLSSL